MKKLDLHNYYKAAIKCGLTINDFKKMQLWEFNLYQEAYIEKIELEDTLISKQTTYLLNIIGGALSKNWKTLSVDEVIGRKKKGKPLFQKNELADPKKAKDFLARLRNNLKKSR